MALERLDRPPFYGAVSRTRIRIHVVLNKLRRIVGYFLLLALMWSAGSRAENITFQSLSLISVEQFQALRESGAQWLAIDVRPKLRFFLGHIPGVFNLWRPDYEAIVQPKQP